MCQTRDDGQKVFSTDEKRKGSIDHKKAMLGIMGFVWTKAVRDEICTKAIEGDWMKMLAGANPVFIDLDIYIQMLSPVQTHSGLQYCSSLLCFILTAATGE